MFQEHLLSRFILSLVLGLSFILARPAWSAELQIPEEGYALSSVDLPFEGGMDFLADGDIVGLGFYNGALSLMRYDANGDGTPAELQVLHSLTDSFFGSFVKVSPSGNKILFSESNLFRIFSYDVSAQAVTNHLTLGGAFDAAFLDEQRIFLSAGSADVYFYDLESGADPVLILQIPGAPSGAVASDSEENLYYVRSDFTFPPVEPKHILYRFDRAQIQGVLTGGPVLEESDGVEIERYRSGYAVRVNDSGQAFVSDTGGAAGDAKVYRTAPEGATDEFLTVSSGAGFFSHLAWLHPNEFFQPFRASTGRLAVVFSDFIQTSLYFAEPLPAPGDFDRDGDVDYTNYVHFRQCRLGIKSGAECVNANLDGDAGGVIDDSDEAVFWMNYTGPDNQAPTVPTPAPQTIGDDASLNLSLNAQDPEGFPLSYEITCTKPGGSRLGGRTQVNPYNASVSPTGIFSWSPQGRTGGYDFYIKIMENVPGLTPTDDPRVSIKSINTKVRVRVNPASLPQFTSVQLNGIPVSLGLENRVPDNALLEIQVSDTRGIDHVEILFKGFGSRPRANYTRLASFNTSTGKWEHLIRYSDFVAEDYRVTITAYNTAGLTTSYSRFDVYLEGK